MVTLPISATVTGPFSLNSFLVVLVTGTCIAMRGHRSGRRTSAPPTGIPGAAASPGEPLRAWYSPAR